VTLAGTNFIAGGTTVTVSGAGVVVNGVSVTSSSSLVATLQVSGASGGRNVTVSTAGGTAPAASFTINANSLAAASALNVTTPYGLAGQPGSTDATGTAARFYTPYGAWGDGDYLYIADHGNPTIRKIALATGTVTTLAGLAGSQGSADGIGSAAQFFLPHFMWGDGVNLYVSDQIAARKGSK
jgi:hypothetical protein